MKPDYIPITDADFDAWQKTLATMAADVAALAPSPPELAAARAAWEAAYPAHRAAQSAARTATEAKTDSRRAYVAALRRWVRQIQADPTTTDALRARLGITIPDTIRTAAAAPTECPMVGIEHGQRLQQQIDFRVLGSGRRKKPAGVRGCQIWVKLGAPPTGYGDTASATGDLRFVALATATPHIVTFSSADAGKTAYYLCRWISTRGEVGPWSETVEATVAG